MIQRSTDSRSTGVPRSAIVKVPRERVRHDGLVVRADTNATNGRERQEPRATEGAGAPGELKSLGRDRDAV